ncbi:MAG: UDP-2,3-diacylglucosamine diphosphatase [Pseudomonadota bacterium]|nr:UDP-2,3-diacylglucosamine diphosphatase [Pseudomonadota bacterium]
MRVALLSDAHLAGPDDPNQRRLLRFLASLEADRLCLLGDIFQHWWHFGAAPFPAYAPVVDALRRFSLSFVPGNHDFHAARYFRDVLGAEVAPVLTPRWDGLAVHLTHGDEVDASFGYRAVSAVLRGRPFAAAVDAMGPDRAWRFLAHVSGHPSGTPNPALCARQVALAAARMREGFGLVVSGHTHAPGQHPVAGGTYVNLGDWVTHHTWLLVEDGRPTLLHRTADERDVPVAATRADECSV